MTIEVQAIEGNTLYRVCEDHNVDLGVKLHMISAGNTELLFAQRCDAPFREPSEDHLLSVYSDGRGQGGNVGFSDGVRTQLDDEAGQVQIHEHIILRGH
jgi:hypothetical protein